MIEADGWFQIRTKSSHRQFRLFAHLGPMAFVVKEDRVLHPSKVGLFGSYTVVADANDVAGLLEEFRHGEVLPNSR